MILFQTHHHKQYSPGPIPVIEITPSKTPSPPGSPEDDQTAGDDYHRRKVAKPRREDSDEESEPESSASDEDYPDEVIEVPSESSEAPKTEEQYEKFETVTSIGSDVLRDINFTFSTVDDLSDEERWNKFATKNGEKKTKSRKTKK